MFHVEHLQKYMSYKIEIKEKFRALCETLTYYSKYGIIRYNAPETEWNEFLKRVLPSELANVLKALSIHLNINYENEATEENPSGTSTEPKPKQKKGK